MIHINKAVLIGRLTKDPESKSFQSGATMTTFTLAVDRRFTNKETGKREADFINIVCWRQTAEYAHKYLTKGRKVAVEGTIQVRSYDAQDGTKRYVTEIIADSVEALDSKPQEEAAAPHDAPHMTGPGYDDDPEDELPF